MEIETYVLPLHWASALINDDCSGMEEAEIAEMTAFCEGLGPCVGISDEEEFSWRNDANNLGGSVATFHFQVLEDRE